MDIQLRLCELIYTLGRKRSLSVDLISAPITRLENLPWLTFRVYYKGYGLSRNKGLNLSWVGWGVV